MDDLLFEKKGPNPKVLWRPHHGRPVAPSASSYRPFQQIVRTIHVQDALHACLDQILQPKPIYSKSTLNRSFLEKSKSNHPCKNLMVLWFGTEPPRNQGNEEMHDWYGNVQFGVSTDFLMHRWKNFYLVEMETTPKHTVSRILITNRDYSKVLPLYDPWQEGGPWYITSKGHFVLTDCSRYNGEGMNKNGHTLELMIEGKVLDQMAILNECIITFRNHSKTVRDGEHALALCHRSRFSKENCPSPLTSVQASIRFFDQHRRMAMISPVATPRLSESAEKYRRLFYTTFTVPVPYGTFLSLPRKPPVPWERRKDNRVWDVAEEGGWWTHGKPQKTGFFKKNVDKLPCEKH
ncbi:uncharacterized protein LOC135222643 isoform X5 [Macrobrachium nipponense]